MSLGTERLAWLVLQATNRTQAKNSTDRLIFPRDPEVLEELGQTLGVGLADRELLPIENYLLEHGYVASADLDLSTDSYSITTAGFEWLYDSLSEPSIISQDLYDQARTGDETGFGAPEPSEKSGMLPQEVGSAVLRGERDRLLHELEQQRLQIERLEAELRRRGTTGGGAC